MPKVVSAEELDTVLAAVSQYPDGIGVEQLHSAIAVMPRRTLQRRLAELVAAKRLLAEGQGRGRKYRLLARPATQFIRPASIQSGAVFGTPTVENYVPLSPGGAELRDLVLKDALPEPDPLRLRYRAELREVVSAMVRNARPLQREAIRELAAPLVEVDDLTAIVGMAVNELHHLHEGNLARYGLRLSEFKEWQHTRR